jgi:hypothetical protein
MRRRRVLGAVGALGGVALSGCVRTLQTTYGRVPPAVEDPPATPYVPTHADGMKMIGAAEAGDLRVALTYTYPHRFWTVENEGGDFVTRRLSPGRDDEVHLMVTPFDPETGVVVPNTGVSVEISRDGSLVSEEVVYPMLSQRMGLHYGANVPLDGDGAYDVRVSVGGLDAARFGAFEGQFTAPAAASVSFDYSRRDRDDISYRVFEDRVGQRGAVRPMEMESLPVGVAPASLPGTPLGRARSGALSVLGTALDDGRFGDRPYLAASPRTPHNGLVVAGMGVEARVERDGDVVYDGSLDPGLDPEVGFHYGVPVEGLSAADEVTLRVPVPPQVARHEGYETAFLDFDPATLRRS